MKKVAIIIPIYNVEKFLDDCIKSCLNQTYKNIDILLVNDGSTDENSLKIAKSYVKQDPRIILIDKENGGLGNARNVGLKYYLKNYDFEFECIDEGLAKYSLKTSDEHKLKAIYFSNQDLKIPEIDCVVFLDSDDMLKENAIKLSVENIKSHDVLWYDFEFLFDGIKPNKNKKTHHEFFNIFHSFNMTKAQWLDMLIKQERKTFWFGRHGMIAFKFIKKTKLFFINDIIHEDEFYGTALFFLANSVYVLNERLYIYRIRANSIMNYDKNINISNLSSSVQFLYYEFSQDIHLAKQYYKDSSLAISAMKTYELIDGINNYPFAKNKFIKVFYKELILRLNAVFKYDKDPFNLKQNATKLIKALLDDYDKVLTNEIHMLKDNATEIESSINLKPLKVDNYSKEIAIIVPIYNVYEYLDECLNSLLNQTYKYFKIILIDDGSTDESFNKAKEYALKDDRIYLIKKQNQGQSKARNLGLDLLTEKTYLNKIAQNEFMLVNFNEHYLYTNEKNINDDVLEFNPSFVMFVDGDDLLAKNCLNECILNINNADIIWFDFLMFADKNYKGEVPNWNRMKRFDFKQNQIISANDFSKLCLNKKIMQFAFIVDGMISFDLIKRINHRFPLSGYAEDHYFGLVLFLEARLIQVYKKVFYKYRVRSGSSCNFDKKSSKLSHHQSKNYEFFLGDVELAKDYYNFSAYLDTTFKLVEYFKSRNYDELACMIIFNYYNHLYSLMKFFKYRDEDILKLYEIEKFLLHFGVEFKVYFKIKLYLSSRIGAYFYYLKDNKVKSFKIINHLLNIKNNYIKQKSSLHNFVKNIKIKKYPKEFILGNRILRLFFINKENK